MSIVKANSWQLGNGNTVNTIIQHATFTFTGNQSFSSPGVNYQNTNVQVSITAKSANSLFIVYADIQGYSTSFSTGWNIGIRRVIGGSSTLIAGYDGQHSAPADTWMGFGHSSGIANSSWSKLRTAHDLPGVSAGTSLTYIACLGGWTSGGVCSIGWTSHNSDNTITVLEIAQ